MATLVQIPTMSDGRFAGKRCALMVLGQGYGGRNPLSHPCMKYARYAVSSDGTPETTELSCGQHISDVIRKTWIKHGTGAVVQEIPGMWRS